MNTRRGSRKDVIADDPEQSITGAAVLVFKRGVRCMFFLLRAAPLDDVFSEP
jgi:hypothetical protein